ncbi:MAG: nitroreductase family protein [Promethearchaeota archaeon]
MVEIKDTVKNLVNSKIEVDLTICIKCEACVRECPLRLYYIRENKLVMRRLTDIACMECGHCLAVCPVDAIKLKNFPIENIVEITEEFDVPTYDMFLNLIKLRRSVRQFKQQPIPEDIWNKLIEAGRLAPTGHNDQLIHFTIVRNQELLEKFSNEITRGFKELSVLYEDLKKRSQVKSIVPKEFRELVKGVLQGFKDTLKGIERGEEFWRWRGEIIIIHALKKTSSLAQDCSLAASNIMLAAETLGLGTCSLGLATAAINLFESVANIVNLPKTHVAAYSLAVGFPKVKYFRIPARQSAKVTWF